MTMHDDQTFRQLDIPTSDTDRPFVLNARRIIVYPKRKRQVQSSEVASQTLPAQVNKNILELRFCNLSTFSKISRSLVTITCICIFLYLAITFFKTYSEYPTTVDVEVSFPDDPILPGLTVCSNNYFRKSLLQKVFPPAGQWNEIFPNRSDVLRMIARKYKPPSLKKLSHQDSTFFKECKFQTETEFRPSNICSSAMWFYHQQRPCFVMNTDWHGISKSEAKKNDTNFHMILDLEPQEYIDLSNRSRASADVFLHGRLDIPDSRTTHFKARGGKTYEIGLLKTSVKLLEKPYQSGCFNYTKDFFSKYPDGLKESDKVASKRLSQQEICLGETVCETMCRMQAALRVVSCIPFCLPFGEAAKKCTTTHSAQKKSCTRLTEERQRCFDRFISECEVVLYDILTDEEEGITIDNEQDDSPENETQPASASNSRQNNNITKIIINLEVARHTIYTHSPKISPIELLGYIGGYLGIFCGISIPMMYDTFLFLVSYTNEFAKREGRSLKQRLQTNK